MTYQQVGEQNGHQNEKDHPQEVGHHLEWDLFGDLSDAVYTSRSLLENTVKLKLPGGHCHSLENGACWVREWRSREEWPRLKESHVERQPKGNQEEPGQNEQLPESVENVKEHQHIDPCSSWTWMTHTMQLHTTHTVTYTHTMGV